MNENVCSSSLPKWNSQIWKRSLEWVESLDLDHSIGATEDTGSNTDENLEDDSDNYDEKKKITKIQWPTSSLNLIMK